jgi:hypothetical protein
MKKGIGLIAVALMISSEIAGAIDVNPLYSLETIVVESFEGASVYPGTQDAIEWSVVASRNIAEGFPQTVMANTWPKDKFGENPDNAAELRAYGINAGFTRRGDNWLEIRPGRGGNPEPLPLEGRVEVLSLWVWGSDYNYNLDACFIDSEGIEYRIPMGNLKFKGWRHVSAVIPKSIDQTRTTFPYRAPLRLSKFIVTTNNRERADDFYIYFDDITILTHQNLFQSYDGSDLTQQATLNAIWGERPQPAQPAPAPTPAEPGQYPPSATSPSANPGIGTDNPAYQRLQEISVSKMEDPVFWFPQVSSDYGLVTIRSFPGSPAGKQPIEGEDEANAGGADEKVLGLRLNFFRRGMQDMVVKAVRPMPVEGIVKAVSVWVAGRNAPHTLYLQLRDYNGNLRELKMGTLDYTGWKQMSVAIPSSIKQQDDFYDDRAGLSIEGFRIAFNLPDTGGTYFIYFDDLRALTDLYPVTVGRDPDNPEDNW